jgi:hypothetical protein
MILICPECRPNTFSSASEISPTGRLRPRRGHREREQVLVFAALGALGDRGGRARERLQRRRDGPVVALLAQPGQLGQLLGAHARVVDDADLDLLVGRHG